MSEVLRKILRTGSASRAWLALQHGPEEGMTVEEVADITGLSPLTLRKAGLRLLFNAQIADFSQDEQGHRTYRLVNPIDSSAARHPGAAIRGRGGVTK